MRLLYLILLASFGSHAAERYAPAEDIRAAMDAYSRAANLQPLKASGEDELRLWARGYMSGRIDGYVFSKYAALNCQASSSYAEDIVTIERARCRRWSKGEDTLDALGALSALDGKQWDCPLFDGVAIYVEGVSAGRRFAFRVSNPSACDDLDSKAVLDLLAKLR